MKPIRNDVFLQLWSVLNCSSFAFLVQFWQEGISLIILIWISFESKTMLRSALNRSMYIEIGFYATAKNKGRKKCNEDLGYLAAPTGVAKVSYCCWFVIFEFVSGCHQDRSFNAIPKKTLNLLTSYLHSLTKNLRICTFSFLPAESMFYFFNFHLP